MFFLSYLLYMKWWIAFRRWWITLFLWWKKWRKCSKYLSL